SDILFGHHLYLLSFPTRRSSDLNAVSYKGAQGIAQFMPGTAEERGLADPFEPKSAIGHSASLLTDLRREFGNFGLAAAAYNAGRSEEHTSELQSREISYAVL